MAQKTSKARWRESTSFWLDIAAWHYRAAQRCFDRRHDGDGGWYETYRAEFRHHIKGYRQSVKRAARAAALSNRNYTGRAGRSAEAFLKTVPTVFSR